MCDDFVEVADRSNFTPAGPEGEQDWGRCVDWPLGRGGGVALLGGGAAADSFQEAWEPFRHLWECNHQSKEEDGDGKEPKNRSKNVSKSDVVTEVDFPIFSDVVDDE